MRILYTVLPFLAGCDVLFQLREVEPGAAVPPAVVRAAAGNCTDCATKTVPFMVTEGAPATFMLVSVVSSRSGGAPAITSVGYGTAPLKFSARATAATATDGAVVETWTLLDPAPGAGMLTVNLAGNASVLAVGVTQLEGVSATAPVRASAPAGSTSMGLSADNQVSSTDLDLVVDAVCGGTTVDAPGGSQTVLYIQNVSPNYACGNLGASWTMGAAASVSVHWAVNGSTEDHWIDLATSIAPAE